MLGEDLPLGVLKSAKILKKDCKARTATKTGASCCVLKQKDSTTFECVAAENTEDSLTAYLA